MFWLVQLLVPIAVVVVLPVMIVWIIFRATTNHDNKNAEIIMKAIESNSTIDADKLVEALGKKAKSPKEMLHSRLLRGCIFTFLGIAAAIYSAILANSIPNSDELYLALMVAGVGFAIGIAYLVVYFVTRKSVEGCDNNE